MPAEAQTSAARIKAVRAFVRSLNILIKFARLYGFEHARTAEQFQMAWTELRSAIQENTEGGLLLGASGTQLLLDGAALDASPAERSFAQLISAAGLSSVHFSPQILPDDFAKLVRAFPTGNAKPSVLAEQLKAALAGNPNIRVNQLRFVAEDAEVADGRATASLTARQPGADDVQVKEWCNDPQRFLQLIAAAEHANTGSRGDKSLGLDSFASSGTGAGIGRSAVRGSTANPGAASGLASGGVSIGQSGEAEILSVLRLLGQMGQKNPPGSELAHAQIQNEFAQLPGYLLKVLKQALNAMVSKAPSQTPRQPLLVNLAEDLVIQFAVEQCERGEVRVSAVSQMLDRMNQEIDSLRHDWEAKGERTAAAGVVAESHLDLLDRQFWSRLPDSNKRAILTSEEAWCIPARNIRPYIEELLARGETELIQGILRHYVSCVANKENDARRKVAVGLSELAEVYGAGDGTSLEFAISRLGPQMCLEREAELHTLQCAALARLSQEAITRRNFPAILRALECATSLESQRPTVGQGLWPRLGVESRLGELLDDALRQKAVPEGLPAVLGKMPSVAAEQLMRLFNRCTYREDCDRIAQIAGALDQSCLTHLRDILRGTRPSEAIETVGLLSRLQPGAVSEYLPPRLRETAPAAHDRVVRLLACGGAPERGHLLLDLLPFLDVLVRPLALEEIGMSANSSALPKLLQLAEEENPAVCAPYARLKAIEALGRLSSTPGATILRHILETKQLWRWVFPAELRIAAFQAMQKIDPEWTRNFLPQSGLEQADLTFRPLDPIPDSPWYRQRRYPRLRLTQPVPAVTTSSKEIYRLDIKLLSLSGGLATFDRHIGPGTIVTLRIGSGMRTFQAHTVVRTARTQGLSFEILDITLEDRSRLRKLLHSHAIVEPSANRVDPSSPGRLSRPGK